MMLKKNNINNAHRVKRAERQRNGIVDGLQLCAVAGMLIQWSVAGPRCLCPVVWLSLLLFFPQQEDSRVVDCFRGRCSVAHVTAVFSINQSIYSATENN